MGKLNRVFDKSEIIEDEIALEGLDGITLQGLWVRLSIFNEFKLLKILTDDNLKKFVWCLAKQIPVIKFYQLQQPRPHLKVFNRYEHIEEEFGTIVEQQEQTDVYPICIIEDNKDVQGSCAAYKSRKLADVYNLSYKGVTERYGDTLIMVASQRRRNRALGIDERLDVNCHQLSAKQYVMLERIGRSRSLGELSHGKNSLAVLGESPKSLFYIRKRLLQLNLISKQVHRQKSLRGVFNMASLFHLTRFYVQRKSKMVIMIETIIETIKQCENFMCPLSKIKEVLKVPAKLRRKLFESAEFLRFVQLVMVPYREVNPDYVGGHKCKTERMVRYFTVIDHNVTVEDVHKSTDDVDNDVDEIDIYPGHLNIENQAKVAKSMAMGIGPLNYAQKLAREAGPDGITQLELASAMGLTKLDSRSICRNGVSNQFFALVMKDMGRQRVSRYVSNGYAQKGGVAAEYLSERRKMISHMDVKPTCHVTDATTAVEQSESDIEEPPRVTEEPCHVIERDDNELIYRSPVPAEEQSVEWQSLPSTSQVSSPVTIAKSNAENYSVDPSIQSEIIEEHVNDSRANMSFLEKDLPDTSLDTTTHTTARVLRRANLIVDMVRKQKVIDHHSHLNKMINKSEQTEGVTGKMDKKSLTRIVKRLANSKLIKLIRVKLNRNSYSKILNYIVDPSITKDSPEFMTSIDCNKQMFLMKSFIHENVSIPPEIKALPRHVDDLTVLSTKPVLDVNKQSVGVSVQELKKMNDRHNQDGIIKKPTVNKGVGSKFVRMRELHHMLFYLVYDYRGSEELDQELAWNSLTRIHSVVNDEERQCYPKFYSMERSWKMFVPPLPKHVTTTSAGWVFVVDILLRLPLCLFVCIVNVASYEDELQPYLSHPIKKFLLVKDLPAHIRGMILRGRKYVTYVIELLHRLCQIGLVQLGNQILKEKDHVFIYINRNAVLVDTTTTRPAYYQISMNQEYVRDQYRFDDFQDVISYWLDMETICLHTPLGCHSSIEGKETAMEQMTKRPDFSIYMMTQSLEEAPLKDTGYIPGDGLGAAGMDASLYAHLRRNWCLKTNKYYAGCQISISSRSAFGPGPEPDGTSTVYARYLKNTSTSEPTQKQAKSHPSNTKKYKLTLYKPPGQPTVPIKTVTEYVDKSALTKKKDKSKIKNVHRTTSLKKSGNRSRRMISRKKGPCRKPYYDALDREALKRMDKLRVEWSHEEDSLLIMCRVASMKLFPNRRTQISFVAVRDQLHARLSSSLNKTSRACQRRVNYMLKDKSTERSFAILLEEIIQDPDIKRNFKPLKMNPIGENLTVEVLNKFSHLLSQIIDKFKSFDLREPLILPNSYKKLVQNYGIHTCSTLKHKIPICTVKSTTDIDYSVVYSLMFSCLCTLQDRESWGYQLYLAYQQYPQQLLEKVINNIRLSKMTSFKKYASRNCPPRKCLPLTTSPYQLSLRFIYLFNQKHQYDVYSSCWNLVKQLVNSKERSFQMLTECCLSSENTAGAEEDIDSEDMFASPEKVGHKRKLQPSAAPSRAKIRKLDSKDLIVSQDGLVAQEFEEIFGHVENIELEEEKVDMSAHNLGGNTAAVISLMSSDRITFDVTIPEQIFILKDKNIDSQRVQREKQTSLETRIQNLEDNSGRKSFVWDLGLPHINGRPIDLRAGQVNASAKLQEPAVTDEEAASTMMDMEFISNPVASTSHDHVQSVDQPAKASVQAPSFSRATMHLIKSSGILGVSLDPDAVEKSNIEIKCCQVKVALQLPSTLDTVPVISAKHISKFYLPCVQDVLDKALARREKVLVVEPMNVEEIWTAERIRESNLVKAFIETCQDIGATASMLKAEFKSKLSCHVMQLVRDMEDVNIIWRMGSETLHWVSYKFVGHWVIHTNKIPRHETKCDEKFRVQGVYAINSRKSQPAAVASDVNIGASTSTGGNDAIRDNTESMEDSTVREECLEPPTKKLRISGPSANIPDQDSESSSAKAEDAIVSHLMPSRVMSHRQLKAISSKLIEKERQIEKTQREMQFDSIDVALRPWVRLNGSINRRVMDRFLGSVLSYCLEIPGATGKTITSRFWPAIVPAHTYELLDTLLDIKCLYRRRIKLREGGIFSDQTEVIDKGEVPHYDFDEDYAYVPTPEAILRQSMFIGDKTYSVDFLKNCR